MRRKTIINNRKGFILAILFLLPMLLNAQVKTEILFNNLTYNFDTINLDTNDYSCSFQFMNTSDVPLLITEVTSSCGCTIATWPQDAIPPGKSGSISVTYHASHQGNFVKTILVKSKARSRFRTILQIKGHVID